jgi:hypothetical protein
MTRTPANGSSAVNSYAYDADAGALTIERPNGVLYNYSPITRGQYEQFVSAESKGKFLSDLMREGCECRRVPLDVGGA